MNQNVRVVTRESDSKFVFDTCCCCIPLKTGCLILAYLQLVGYIVAGIFALLTLAGGVVVVNSDVKEEQKYIAQILIVFGVLTLVAILIALPFTILLLVGLHKERRNYVKIYLIFAVVCLVVHLVLQVSKFSGGFADPKEIPSALVSIVLTIYFLLVLRSHYIKMGISSNNVAMQQYRPEGHLMNEPKV